MALIKLESDTNCKRCGGSGWLQRVTFFRGRVKAKRCPNCT